MATSEPTILRRLAFAYILVYPILVASFALLKVTTQMANAVTWAELVFGPAITLVSAFALVWVGVWIECQIRIRA